IADVFSWLSALLWKIGDTWRYAQRPKTGQESPHFEFWQYVKSYYQIHEKVGFGCGFCTNRHCQPYCRPRSLMSKVLRQRAIREWLYRAIRDVTVTTRPDALEG